MATSFSLMLLLLLRARKKVKFHFVGVRTYSRTVSCSQQKDSLTTRGDGKVLFSSLQCALLNSKRISLFRFNARSQHVHYSTHTLPHPQKKKSQTEKRRPQRHFVELLEKNQMNKVFDMRFILGITHNKSLSLSYFFHCICRQKLYVIIYLWSVYVYDYLTTPYVYPIYTFLNKTNKERRKQTKICSIKFFSLGSAAFILLAIIFTHTRTHTKQALDSIINKIHTRDFFGIPVPSIKRVYHVLIHNATDEATVH